MKTEDLAENLAREIVKDKAVAAKFVLMAGAVMLTRVKASKFAKREKTRLRKGIMRAMADASRLLVAA